VRREVGETRTHAVRLIGTSRADDDVTARFDVAGTTYDVVVRRSHTAEEHLLTCRARRAEVAPTYDVLAVTRV
jgi:hypothetical protein